MNKMSKTIKRKISVELPKARDLSKNRPSVFQRLGSKRQKAIGISEGKLITKTLKQTLSAAVNISTTTSISLSAAAKPDNVELEDVDPDILEKKRAEIQKELELQAKMDSRKAAATMRKRKRQRSSSSSSSSSSGSGSSSSSSSSSSSPHRSSAKGRKGQKAKRRASSSSSEETRTKKLAKKKACHAKKEAHAKLHRIGHSKKLHVVGSVTTKAKKHPTSPTTKKQRLISGHKVILKGTKLPEEKHHRLREKEKEKEREREREFQQREREREKERERERLRLREKEQLVRSRSPKIHPKSRSPKRLSRSRELIKTKSPLPRRPSPAKSRLSVASSSRSVARRHDSRDRERRDKERQDRETAREKERREALARCQERQRERERMAKEKSRRDEEDDRKIDRLLPRPAERAMALAAARDRSRDSPERGDRHLLPGHSMEKDPIGTYGRGYVDRSDDGRPYEHRDRRPEKEVREHGRDFRRLDEENLRDGSRDRALYENQQYEEHLRRDDRRGDYPSRTAYDEQRHRLDRDREWSREEIATRDVARDSYDRTLDRHQQPRDWDRSHHGDIPHGNARDNYNDSREWSTLNEKGTKQWDNREGSNWPQEENWDRYNDDKWTDQSHGRGHVDKPAEHNANSSAGSGPGRRWTSWRARRSNHHNEFRRHEIFEERGEIYRRHINPQGNNASTNSSNANTTVTSEQQKPVSPAPARSTTSQQKTPEPPLEEPIEKSEEAKEIQPIDEPAGEEIADDLSEISDEADDILNRQEDEFPLSPVSQLLRSSTEDATINRPRSLHKSHDDDFDSQFMGSDFSNGDELAERNKHLLAGDASILETRDISENKPDDVTTLKIEPETLDPKLEDVPPKDIIPDEIDLDFEEISDGELEEEARIKGLGDALGVDWASLVEESKKIAREKSKAVEASARQRWQPHRILLDTGISFKMAGESFARKTLTDAQTKLIEEIEQVPAVAAPELASVTIKAEPIDPDERENEIAHENVVEVKKEKEEDTGKMVSETEVGLKEEEKETFKLEMHPLACIQVGTRVEASRRQQLVFNAVGPYSRALCARRDIAMRRQLCGLPVKENNCKLAVAKLSSGYESIAVKLFQKALGHSN